MREIQKILFFPVLILLLQGIFLFFNAYRLFGWLDIPMHFFGGIIIGNSFFLLLKLWQKKGFLGKTSPWLFLLLVLSLVALIVVIWEFLEFGAGWLGILRYRADLVDTLQDLFLGLLGGIIGGLIAFYRSKK